MGGGVTKQQRADDTGAQYLHTPRTQHQKQQLPLPGTTQRSPPNPLASTEFVTAHSRPSEQAAIKLQPPPQQQPAPHALPAPNSHISAIPEATVPQAPAQPHAALNPRQGRIVTSEDNDEIATFAAATSAVAPQAPPLHQPHRRGSLLLSANTMGGSTPPSLQPSTPHSHALTAEYQPHTPPPPITKPVAKRTEDSPPPECPESAAKDLMLHTGVEGGISYRPVARSVSPAAGLYNYTSLGLASLQSELKQNHKVFRVCLTGGPCAGKSTMLAEMQSKVPQRLGYQVLCVPEAATLLVTGGMQWDANLAVEQQLCLLRTQLALEDQFYALAVASGKPSIVVSDRGTMDGRAFCTDEQFAAILKGLGCTLDVLRDRYDAVIHMVTSAIGAEAFYNLDNPARYEDLDGARASDVKLRQMYVGHPMFRILDNSGTFESKIEGGLDVVAQLVGQQQPSETQVTNHYLVRRCPRTLPIASCSYEVTTTILSNSQMNEVRLVMRRVMADGSAMHFFRSIRTSTVRQPSGDRPLNSLSRRGSAAEQQDSQQRSITGRMAAAAAAVSGSRVDTYTQQRVESAQRISSKEYASLLKHRDVQREEVVCGATHFIFEGANFELTTILAPRWAAGKQTLTVESTTSADKASGKEEDISDASPQSEVVCPAFLEVDREVPIDSSTTAFLISHRETGPLYTSLAFAPVFARTVSAIGSHADVQDILCSTRSSSTPYIAPSLRVEATGGSLRETHQPQPREEAQLPDGKDVPQATPLQSRGGLNVLSNVNSISIGGKEKAAAAGTAPTTSVPGGIAQLHLPLEEPKHAQQQYIDSLVLPPIACEGAQDHSFAFAGKKKRKPSVTGVLSSSSARPFVEGKENAISA